MAKKSKSLVYNVCGASVVVETGPTLAQRRERDGNGQEREEYCVCTGSFQQNIK